MIRDARCSYCRFWNVGRNMAGEKQMFGWCQIRSPRVMPGKNHPAVWPVTYEDDWCGEWQEAYRKKEGDAGG